MSALKGPILVLLGSLCFSTTGLMQVLAPQGANAVSTAFFRMAVGSICLFIWCFFTGQLRFDWKTLPWKRLIACALCLTEAQVFFFSSVKDVGVAVGTVVYIGVAPCAAAIFAFLLYRKKPSTVWWLSTALAITGVVLMNDLSAGRLGDMSALGFIVAAGFGYALYVTISPVLLERLSAEASIAIISSLVSLALLPAALCMPMQWVLSPMGLFTVFDLGIVTAGLAFTLVLNGLKQTDSTVASTLLLGEPLGAVGWGVLLLGEQIGFIGYCGMTMVFFSIVLLCWEQHRRSKTQDC